MGHLPRAITKDALIDNLIGMCAYLGRAQEYPCGQTVRTRPEYCTSCEAAERLRAAEADRDRLQQAIRDLVTSLEEAKVACAAGMRVIAGIDAATRMGIPAEDACQRFVDECHLSGVKDGFAVRADAVIAKSEALLTPASQEQP